LGGIFPGEKAAHVFSGLIVFTNDGEFLQIEAFFL